MIDDDLSAELDKLAQAIARMKPPSNQNPHAFHEDRSELASRARAIAARARFGPVAKKPLAERLAEKPAGIGSGREVRQLEGRTIMVLRRRPGLPTHSGKPQINVREFVREVNHD